MSIREQNLEASGAVYLSFEVNQTAGVDDVKNADIGKAMQLVGNYKIKPAADGTMVIGKLTALTLTDADNETSGYSTSGRSDDSSDCGNLPGDRQ